MTEIIQNLNDKLIKAEISFTINFMLLVNVRFQSTFHPQVYIFKTIIN